MGRPSLAVERTEQILAAAERCIERHGLRGATLERISAESGLGRGHVRHYAGSRGELMEVAWARLAGTFVLRLHAARTTPNCWLDLLFGNGDDVPQPCLWPLLIQTADDDVLAEPGRRTMVEVEHALAEVLVTAGFPAGSATAELAHDLVSLAVGQAARGLINGPGTDDLARFSLRRVAERRLADRSIDVISAP